MEPKRSFRIFARSAVRLILRLRPQFQQFLDRYLIPGGPIRLFPDGAIEIDEGRCGAELLEFFKSYTLSGSGFSIQGAGTYPSIGPFGNDKLYAIQYSSEYQNKLKMEGSFHVGRGMFQPPSPGEFDLDQLEITGGFRTRPAEAKRLAFVDSLTRWSHSVSEQGIFGDGPIALASPGVSFNGIRAWFRIDARYSGQDTLNWLALAILNFGEDVHVITRVDYGQSADLLDLNYGPIHGEIAIINFMGGLGEEPIKNVSEFIPTSHVPSTAKRAKGFRSRRFPVLALFYDEWDSFVATIYFGRSFHRDERQRLVSLLNAWMLLAAHGGLGGTGTHSSEKITCNEETDSVIVEADMGDVNPRIALPALIRLLEGFEQQGPPIDALVFGRSDPYLD